MSSWDHPASTPSHHDGHASRPLVLPTRVFASTSSSAVAVASTNEGLTAHPEASIRWVAQPVLEWLEQLAATAEHRMEMQDTNGMPSSSHHHQQPGDVMCLSKTEPICIGQVQLSHPSEPLPFGSVHAWEMKQATKNSKQNQSSWMIPYEASTTGSGPIVTEPIGWDLSWLEQLDPDANCTFVSKIQQLASQIEGYLALTITGKGSTIQRRAHNDYVGVQMHLNHVGPCVVSHSMQTPDETRSLLDTLYQQVISKLHDIHQILTPIANTGTRANKSSILVVDKKDFPTFMTAWLLRNWINPYPDEEGLTELAAQCQTTTTVISNWLINARTRKWRPAILKAISLGRPADLLWEDSMNLFQGNAIRILDKPNGIGLEGHTSTKQSREYARTPKEQQQQQQQQNRLRSYPHHPQSTKSDALTTNSTRQHRCMTTAVVATSPVAGAGARTTSTVPKCEDVTENWVQRPTPKRAKRSYISL